MYNLFSKDKLNNKIQEKINEQKWTSDENRKLIESMKKNNNWDDVVKSLGKNNNKTKTDCILHLLQNPIPIIELKEDSDKEEKNNVNEENKENKELNAEEINMKEKEIEHNNNNDMKIEEEKKEQEKNDKMENKMLELFMRLFKRYLNEKNQNEKISDENGNISNKSFKEVIYKTFAKSLNKCKELKNEEKNEMKNIVDILVYLEMRKIELKMNYFRQFERLLEYKKTQLKTIETQIIQERIKLITKKLLLQQKQQQANENKQ